jgi:RNA polymerase sigma-70 factor (ECF subfamily)
MNFIKTDRSLLLAFRAGSKEALKKVYLHYVDSITQFLKRGVVLSCGGAIKGIPAHDIVDLVQETFIKAFSERARHNYDGIRDYKPYLFTIARNLLIDYSKNKSKELTQENFEELLDSKEEVDEEIPWASEDVMKTVNSFVKSLNNELRTIYNLRFVEGQSQIDCAKKLQLGRQVIRTKEAKIKNALRERLLKENLLD